VSERQNDRLRFSFKHFSRVEFLGSLPRLVKRAWNALTTRDGRLRVIYRWRRLRLYRFTGFGSGHAAIYRLRNGRRFVAHPGDHLSEFIAISGCWESLESRIIERILEPGDITIDVGANIGYFSVLFSRCVGPQGKVFSFEPGEKTFAKLQTTIDLLGLKNVEPHAMAVADHTGRQYFTMSTDGYDALQSLDDRDWSLGGKVEVEVPVVTLDEFPSSALLPENSPALVKCDVEGAEMRVLAGGAKLLSSPSPPILMIEMGKDTVAAHGTGVGALLSMLQGYRIYFTPLESNGSVMQAFENPDQLLDTNILAFPTRGAFAGRIAAAKELLSDGGA
jgi:FkbM family methyltransferase